MTPDPGSSTIVGLYSGDLQDWALLRPEGERGRSITGQPTQTWNTSPNSYPNHPISLVYGSFGMDSGGWCSIPNLLLIFKLFKVGYMPGYMHVEFMTMVVYTVVTWVWIENGETRVELLGCVIVLFEVIFGTVMWRGSSGCICMYCSCVYATFGVVYAGNVWDPNVKLIIQSDNYRVEMCVWTWLCMGWVLKCDV